MEEIKVLIHSSVRITGEKTIYVDPFKIDKQFNDADFIFITHDHYDHYSEKDINRVKMPTTIYVVPDLMKKKLIKKGVSETNIVSVIPNSAYKINGIEIETIPAYNINKPFHPKINGWVRICY